jgi:hypothetical protein
MTPVFATSGEVTFSAIRSLKPRRAPSLPMQSTRVPRHVRSPVR